MSTLESIYPMKKPREGRKSTKEILQLDATCSTMYSRKRNSGQSRLC